MEGLHGKSGTGRPNGQRWHRGVVASLVFHMLLFLLIFFVPESMPTRKISGSPVYEVNLVEMPMAAPSKGSLVPVEKTGKEVSSPKAVPIAKRIAPPLSTSEEKPVVIGKRVVERKKEVKQEPRKPPAPTVSPSKLIDSAISKIEKKVNTQKTDHLAQAISKVENRVKANTPDHLAKAISQIETRGQGSHGEGGTETGITIRMYQLAVEEQIKGNWSYPVALMDPKKRKDLEAIVLVKVRQDGAIIKSWFKKQSASSVFDGSVMKAIERSDPLPPFPEGYTKSFDEIEIRFDLSELEDF